MTATVEGRPTSARWTAIVAVVLAAAASACRPAERFAASSDGVVRDATTGLEWTSRDHDASLPWDTADQWCRDLGLGGHDDWRLPEIGELAALYDPSRDEPCGDRRCRLAPAFTMRGPYVWSATARGVGTRFYFDLGYANALSPTVTPELVRRVLCVRGTGTAAPTPRTAPTDASNH